MDGTNFQAAIKPTSKTVETVVADILGTSGENTNDIQYDFKCNGSIIRVRKGGADHDTAFVYSKDHPANDNNTGDDQPYRLEQNATFYLPYFTVVRYALKQGKEYVVNARGTRIFILGSDDLLNGDADADWDAASDHAEEFARMIEATALGYEFEEIAPAPQTPPRPPQPDRSQIKTFVLALFKYATPGNWISLRAFPDKKGHSKPFRIAPIKLNGGLDTPIDQAYLLAEFVARAHEKVVFCPPVATFTNAQHAAERDLAEGLVLSIECDTHPRAALAKLIALLGPPTVVVESGGQWTNPETGETEPKLHIYYRLQLPARGKVEHHRLKEARRLAAKLVGGDRSNVSLVHPIRWPGSVHRKGVPKLCQIIELNPDIDINLDTALESLRNAAGSDRPRARSGSDDKPIDIAEAFKHLDPNQKLAEGIADTPPLPFEPIKEGCAWLREVHDTGGKDQSELLWRDSLRVSMFLVDGKTLIHEFSKQHPGYNFEDTEEKYDEAYRYKVTNDFGWPLCETIKGHDCKHCETCPNLAAEGSPLHLALDAPPAETSSPPPLPFINFANWDHEPIPEYEWSVLGRYPLRQTVLSTGEGAVGKSILKLQLAVAHVLGGNWLNVLPAPGPALFVDAEDDAKVMHIRLAAILRHYGATFADAAKGGLHLISLVGHDAVLGAPTRSGKIEPTALYKQLLEAAGDIKPKMIGIASSADVFAGNEIDRSQVRQFVSLLTRIAIAANGTVSLIAHPSLTGINTGTGLSGNTAWHNSVRARDYMTSIKPSGDGEQPDTDLRQIIFKKNQYGPVAETIVLRYRDGLFLPDTVVDVNRAAREARTDEIFLELLHRLRSENRYVSHNKSAIYAPAIFAKEDVARKAHLNGTDFASAMVRLFAAKKVWNEPHGKPSRPSFRIAPTTTATSYTAATDPSEEGPRASKGHKEHASPDRPNRYRR